jgi:hypothetical protein
MVDAVYYKTFLTSETKSTDVRAIKKSSTGTILVEYELRQAREEVREKSTLGLFIVKHIIRGFWKIRTDCIIDIRTDTDAKSVLSKDPAEVLKTHEREKKRKCLGACLAQRRHFTPFVVSTDGLLDREAKNLLRRLSALLAAKWDKPYEALTSQPAG